MGRSSGWMFLDAANDLFANARLRVCGDPKKGINKGDLNKKYFYTKDNKGTASSQFVMLQFELKGQSNLWLP